MTIMGYLVITHVKTIEQARIIKSATPEGMEGARVVGVFRMPTRDEPVCMGLSSGCKAEGWTRHPRGHMVHACGYRNRNYRDQLGGHAGGLLDTYGINLLPRDKTPAIFRNPIGYDRK